MTEHDIAKALEVWSLQNLVSFSIILGILALGLVLIQTYYRNLEKELTLRASVEMVRIGARMLPDILLAVVVISGYMLLNPDVMADIKYALPFMPLATVLFTAALILRLFYGGDGENFRMFRISTWLLLAANVSNVIGYTMVLEAPSGEYLALHPSTFWIYIKTHLRSNASPSGLELSQTCFNIFFPILILLFCWACAVAIGRLKPMSKGNPHA